MNGAAKPIAGRNIVSKIIALMAVISIAVGGFFYGQTAFDAYRASTFTPPAAVAAVEGSIKLTPATSSMLIAKVPNVPQPSWAATMVIGFIFLTSKMPN